MMSFKLDPGFVQDFSMREPDWGFRDANGTAVGELTFLTKYSRKKADGTKERWHEVCQRVIEGMYSIQKDHCAENRLPWDEAKAHRSAEEAYERMFAFKWVPPGRGLWMMGTPLVMEQKNSAALQNCAFVSTEKIDEDPSRPFAFLMEASMLGIGVGFDSAGADKIAVLDPGPVDGTFVIPDSREGWVESVRILLDAYLGTGRPAKYDYSLIRPAGAPIRTFGGTAAGPEPLIELHRELVNLLHIKTTVFAPNMLDARTIADIGNLIGKCVVAGNVRRSAELFLGPVEDVVDLKDYGHWETRQVFTSIADGKYVRDDDGGMPRDGEVLGEHQVWVDGPSADREAWGWMSNNSVNARRGQDLSGIVERIVANGEPGVVWMDTTQAYGRLCDEPTWKDYRASGYNPCAEQSLESYECCTLVETFLDRHESVDDFERTLKFAYLYAKTVTLLPTHWPETNAIMQRNRRIGTSVSGVANFVDARGLAALRDWLQWGYKVVQLRDEQYSEWLCVRESIKTTTVKPSGTVALLSGSSPGAHWSPGGRFFLRRMTFSKTDPIVRQLEMAGYPLEPAVIDPEGSVVVAFPVESKSKRSERDVSVWEKALLAGELQRYWSDNSVSVTLSFDPAKEADLIAPILAWADGNLKTVSFLPMDNDYEQLPWEGLDEEDYRTNFEGACFPVDLAPMYAGDALDAVGEAFCTTDACEMPTSHDNDD